MFHVKDANLIRLEEMVFMEDMLIGEIELVDLDLWVTDKLIFLVYLQNLLWIQWLGCP